MVKLLPKSDPLPPRIDPHDLADLRESGITDDTLRSLGSGAVCTEYDARKLATMLGYEGIKDFCLGGALVYRYFDEAGCPNCHARIKPRVPRILKDKPVKYESPQRQSPRAYIPPPTRRLLNAGVAEVYITEGEKKTLALMQLGLAAIGIGGVFSWKPKGVEGLIDDLAAVAWQGKTAYVVFDSDPEPKTVRNVAAAARRLAKALRAAGAAEVYIIKLPPGLDGGKNGVDDFLVANAPNGADAFRLLVEQAKNTRPRLSIPISTIEHVVNDQAVAAIAADPEIYQRGGSLVHVLRAEQDETVDGLKRIVGAPRIALVAPPTLRERLTANAEFTKYNARAKEEFAVHPPGWCVSAVHARGQWSGMRHLVGIVDAPVLRADGTVIDRPGYDPVSGLLLLPGGPLPEVPLFPTPAQVKAAVDLLIDLVCDFPFEKPAHRSAWVACLLTILSRHAFEGPSPLTLFDSNTPGSGKGILVSLDSIIATGLDMPVSAAHSDDAEMRKSITAAAVAGDRLVVLDNVSGVLGGPALEAAMTTTRWTDRLLGTNTKVDLPLYATWAATGNNVVVGRDMRRRVTYSRLKSPLEDPEDRRDFRYLDVLGYARGNRVRLLAAALTILRGYCAAGRRDQGLKPWGSFGSWSDLVRGAIVWAGLPDPGETRDDVRRTTNPEVEHEHALLAGIQRLDPGGVGLTVEAMLSKVDEAVQPRMEGDALRLDVDPVVQAMHAALCVLCPSRDGKVSPWSVGMKLHHLRGRVISGMELERIESKKHSVGNRWRVVAGGARGTTSAPSGANCEGGTRGTKGTSRSWQENFGKLPT